LVYQSQQYLTKSNPELVLISPIAWRQVRMIAFPSRCPIRNLSICGAMKTIALMWSFLYRVYNLVHTMVWERLTIDGSQLNKTGYQNFQIYRRCVDGKQRKATIEDRRRTAPKQKPWNEISFGTTIINSQWRACKWARRYAPLVRAALPYSLEKTGDDCDTSYDHLGDSHATRPYDVNLWTVKP
jgi:hypothetical protein